MAADTATDEIIELKIERKKRMEKTSRIEINNNKSQKLIRTVDEVYKNDLIKFIS